MECKNIEYFILNNSINEISNDEKNILMNHISVCEHCKKKYDEMLKTNQMINNYYLFQKTKFNIFAVETKLLRIKRKKYYYMTACTAAGLVIAVFLFSIFLNFKSELLVQKESTKSIDELYISNEPESYFEDKLDSLDNNIILINDELSGI